MVMIVVMQYGGYDSPAGDHVSIAQGHGDLCDVSKQLVLPLSTMKFMGTSVSVPADVPGVLTYRYGETFMIPRCGWWDNGFRKRLRVTKCAIQHNVGLFDVLAISN